MCFWQRFTCTDALLMVVRHVFQRTSSIEWETLRGILTTNIKGVLLSTKTQRADISPKIGHIFWNKQISHHLQVNLFQKHLYLHQLNHSMTKDCSLNCEFSTWKLQAQNMLCTQIFFCFDIQNNLCTHVLSL